MERAETGDLKAAVTTMATLDCFATCRSARSASRPADVGRGCHRFFRCELTGSWSFECPAKTLWNQVSIVIARAAAATGAVNALPPAPHAALSGSMPAEAADLRLGVSRPLQGELAVHQPPASTPTPLSRQNHQAPPCLTCCPTPELYERQWQR